MDYKTLFSGFGDGVFISDILMKPAISFDYRLSRKLQLEKTGKYFAY